MRNAMKHRAAVVAEGRRQVRESIPFVWRAHGLRTQSHEAGKSRFFIALYNVSVYSFLWKRCLFLCLFVAASERLEKQGERRDGEGTKE